MNLQLSAGSGVEEYQGESKMVTFGMVRFDFTSHVELQFFRELLSPDMLTLAASRAINNLPPEKFVNRESEARVMLTNAQQIAESFDKCQSHVAFTIGLNGQQGTDLSLMKNTADEEKDAKAAMMKKIQDLIKSLKTAVNTRPMDDSDDTVDKMVSEYEALDPERKKTIDGMLRAESKMFAMIPEAAMNEGLKTGYSRHKKFVRRINLDLTKED